MKLKYILIPLIILLAFGCSKSDEPVEEKSYTAIPNYYFEKALIDLGIDSEGKRDFKVLTSDISSVLSLDLYDKNIGNLIGIEDFKSLKYLKAHRNHITELDVSKNLNLIELNIGGNLLWGGDNHHNEIEYLDVSKNTSLRKIYVNWAAAICIKVNQEQLDNLEEWRWGYYYLGDDNWNDFYSHKFQLDCN